MARTSSDRVLVAFVLLGACGGDDVDAGDSTSSTSEADDGSSAGDPGSVDDSESDGAQSSDGADTTSTAPGSTETGSTEAGSSDGSSTSAGSESSTTGGVDGLDDDDIMRIHEAVDANLGNGLATGYSIAIWRDGGVIYTEGFGSKDADGNAVTPDTVFQVGSDTKKMTAIALLQRVDAGELALDQNVTDVLGGLDLAQSPGHLAELTVHEMLSHRSGLYDYTPWAEAPDDAMLEQIVTGPFAENEYAMMPPGIAYNYCNPNFALAGLVIESLTDRPWADVVIEDIAAPLGMTQTWARRADALANADDIASGYGLIFAGGIDSYDLMELFATGVTAVDWVTPEAQDDHAFTRPAGLVWSTASDMTRLGAFVMEGDDTLLSAESFDVLRSPIAPFYPGLAPADLGYGYGLMTQRGFYAPEDVYYDVPLVSHGGNTLSMTSGFALLPEQGVVVSVLANGYGEDTWPVLSVALEVAAADGLPAPSEPEPLLGPPRDDLSVYAGTFVERALGEVTLSFDGTDVLIDVPALTMAGYDVAPELIAAAQDVFVMDFEGSYFELSFYDGELPFEFGVNRSFVFTRVEQPIAAPAPDPALVHAWVAHVTAERPPELVRRRR
jgi:CubicO group peptidase (beta-lactamase class C family)